MEQIPSWEADRSSASQEISPRFMEPEGSLPHSQEPATCPYPVICSNIIIIIFVSFRFLCSSFSVKGAVLRHWTYYRATCKCSIRCLLSVRWRKLCGISSFVVLFGTLVIKCPDLGESAGSSPGMLCDKKVLILLSQGGIGIVAWVLYDQEQFKFVTGRCCPCQQVWKCCDL
jgi:hypothetical protein